LTFKKRFLTWLIILLMAVPAFSQRTKSSLSAGEQRHAERGLKNSRYFFYFINTTVSNSGTEREKELYSEAARRDLLARILYLKFEFHNSFTEIKRSQILLLELMKLITEREMEGAMSLLHEFAPYILQSRDNAAKKYLSLGYRASNESGQVQLIADNLPETNYSIRLYEYIKALKLAKYAKRYAIIALIESRIDPAEKGKALYNDYEKKSELISRYLSDEAERLKAIHFDNYYKMEENTSFYDRVMLNPDLESIPEYEKYREEEY